MKYRTENRWNTDNKFMITNTYLNCIHLVCLLISSMYMYRYASEINFSYCEKTWEDLKCIGTQIKKPGPWMQQQFLCRRRTRKVIPPILAATLDFTKN